MTNLLPEYDDKWIKEYPQLDREYMETYPLTFGPLDTGPMLRQRDLHIYVHVPFCASNCSFCTFLHFNRTNANVATYVPLLLKEIDLWFSNTLFRNYRVRSMFFGGGTATSLSPAQIGTVLERIRSSIDVDKDVEISVESHPNSVNESHLAHLRSLGVTRMTFGIQSFNDEHLKNMQLTQTCERNQRILQATKRVGFPSVCMDLMFGLPGQRLSSLVRDLDEFFDQNLDGISCYRYAIDPENPMSDERKQFYLAAVPEEEEVNEMYAYLAERLTTGGYVQFAQPDFAKPGKTCVYTQAVWRAPQGEQLGIGVGALSYNVNNYSLVNTHNLQEYAEALTEGRLPILMGTPITPVELMRKYFVLGMKCIEIDTVKFEEIFGLPWQLLFYEPVRTLERLGLLEQDERFLRLTAKGKLYVDYVCKQFYSHRNRGKRQPDGLLFAQIKMDGRSNGSHTASTFISQQSIFACRPGGSL